ncbi:6-phosphogluconolactonase (cycloisomerase 2 family) [Dysgonomonas alginatilytica]|uniref:6-phosphogluconolactonase (Cycloisomerase 2 family) n=1 Tax=Dysgonomonas alginatilytica TaxID=1605892 RepID=A0A2V3PVT5_9BACT|nr:lactonase family protein [Dysgonomonas alginatilytica]PXV64080.1 6-phosphogluconolactonase (cycloisomerase 2 family) [Dysgonomonas alginatilytica]
MLKKVVAIFSSVFLIIGCGNKNANNNADNQSMDQIEKSDSEMYMLVGTYTSGESKGIYVYKLDTITGTSKYISEIKVDNPSYLVLDQSEKFVYSVTEDEGIGTSAANAFSFDKQDGKLTFINKQLTGGGAPCYINIDADGKHVVTANYLGGSLTYFSVNEAGGLETASQVISFSGKGTDVDRQKQSHIHCVQFTPDGKFLFANDLGTDKIHKFNVNESGDNFLSVGSPAAFSIKGGSGPRHLKFHPNNKFAYVITELSGDVIAFDYNDGNLKEIQTIKADTVNAKGSGDIGITPNGKFLYASNRLKNDGLAIFSINEADGKLTKVGYRTTGVHPRNFAITPNGKLLLVACRDSDVIQVFKIDENTGLLEDTGHDINLDMPVCIKFASIK